MEGRDGNLREHTRQVHFAVKRRRRNHDCGAVARIAEFAPAALSDDARPHRQQRGVGAVGMTCRNNPPTVDKRRVRSTCFRQDAVESKAQVADPRGRLVVVRRGLEPIHDAKRIAAPNGGIAADVLNMQARDAVCGPSRREIRVTPS